MIQTIGFATRPNSCVVLTPRHCRPDLWQISNNVVDNLLEVKEVLRQVKFRGVTGFLDLNHLNRQLIDDINENEEMISDYKADNYVPEKSVVDLLNFKMELKSDDDYEPSIVDDNLYDDGQPPDDDYHPSPGLMGLPGPVADEAPPRPTLPINNALDPATAEKFQVPEQETFEQRGTRVGRWETLSLWSRRSQFQRPHGATP